MERRGAGWVLRGHVSDIRRTPASMDQPHGAPGDERDEHREDPEVHAGAAGGGRELVHCGGEYTGGVTSMPSGLGGSGAIWVEHEFYTRARAID